MRICIECSAVHHTPMAAKFFLLSIGLYYLLLYFYTDVVMGDLLMNFGHPDFADMKGEFYRCISVWNILLHLVVYFSININNAFIFHLTTNDAIVKNFVLPYEKFLEKCFLSVVFPLSWSVCSLFWLVFYLDRETIFPKIMEDLVPTWYNHCYHTLPAIIVTLHLILVEHKSNPLPMETSLKIQSLLHAMYVLLLIYYHDKNGYWLYDFLITRTTNTRDRLLCFSFYIFVVPTITVWLGYIIFNKKKYLIQK